MPDFSKNLFDFYKFLSPADNLGKFTIDSRIGGTDKDRKPIDQLASQKIKETIIENFTPGSELIVKGNFDPPAKLNIRTEQMIQAIRGNYNVIFQESGYDRANFLYAGYFVDYPKSDPPAKKPPPSPQPAAQQADPPAKNFWRQVCGEDGGPPIDFSMIFLRAPMLSRTVSNTDLIQLYLTAMPPTFANQLMPYCDVEFQLPTLGRPPGEPDRVNRPSLYRFLMGSGQDMTKLTEADKSIANVLSPNAKKKNFPEKTKSQTFFGMEMFTSPQTLVNMDTLKQSSVDGSARLNDAKPFLPPASLKDVGITIQNAGAGSFGRRTAGLKLHIHDRKRLVEMAEFLRGSDGYAKSTVWITYGMLAPRGRGENDAYAKFINENMLVREAFVISNTQFSFTPDGGCEVSLTLSGKGGSRGLSTAITYDEIASIKNSLDATIARIKENIAAFGGERSEKLGFSQKEIRMAQFISATAEGNVPTSQEDIKKIKEEIDQVKKLLEAGGQNRGPDFNKDVAIKLLLDLKNAVSTRNDGLKTGAKNFVEKKINALDESKDPFFPDARKNDSNIHSNSAKETPIQKCITEATREPGIRYYDTDLCNLVKNRGEYVSLGRIFTSMCVPAMLRGFSDELNWSNSQRADNDNKCPYEVQFIFYQLNNKCGPVSSHNIAEFPMSKALFVDGFLKLVDSSVGGDAFTLEQMIEFINEQLQDPRQPGYGRATFYKPFAPATDGKEQNLQPSADEDKFTNFIAEWSKKYGDFVTPALTFEIEVGSARKGSSRSTARDLLFDLAGRVAAGYTEPVVKKGADGDKTIIKVHVYDRTCSPLDKITKSLRIASDGTYYLVSSEHASNEKSLEGLQNKQGIPGATISGKEVVLNGETVAVNIGQGKEALLEYLGQMVPRIVIGTEGSLISQVNLQSKTSGLEGTIALQGGSHKRESSLASTGLSQQQFNLPMILFPAQLTINSLGCPLASMGQHFFVDFGTNTTLDNEYVVTQVSHAFSQGKFETTWQLAYYDGYGRMISGNDIESQLKSIKESLKEAEQQAKAPAKR